MKVAIRALWVCLIIVCQTGHSIEVERLYEAEVVAKSELEQDRVAAIKEALTVVLTRILASNDILLDETVKAVLADAIYYVDEYQYALVPSDVKVTSSARLMRVLFDETLLVDVFRQSAVGVWNEIRPRTLVWLVVEEEGKQHFFDPLSMPDVDAVLDRAAGRKRLPTLYPIQDLKEKQSLSISDVLSAYSKHLLKVSQRYDVVSTLAGKLLKTAGCWKVEWTFYFDGKIEQWGSQCGSIENAALNGFQGVYDRLSKYYAVKSEVKRVGSVVLKVANINGSNDLTRVSDYLDSLPMIKTATWANEEDEYNVYRVFYQGRRKLLNDKLARDHVLRVERFSLLNGDEVKYKLLLK